MVSCNPVNHGIGFLGNQAGLFWYWLRSSFGKSNGYKNGRVNKVQQSGQQMPQNKNNVIFRIFFNIHQCVFHSTNLNTRLFTVY